MDNDAIKESLSDLSLRLKRMQFGRASGMTSSSISGVKLHKLEVPTFNENRMNRKAFWKQFNALIHLKKEVNDMDKLTSLRQALLRRIVLLKT